MIAYRTFRHVSVCACLAIVLAVSACVHAADDAARMIDTAQPTTRPAGAPRYSDVCFSSRWIHPKDKNDPHDSLKTIDAFRATRLDWAYISDKKFIEQIKKRGMTFGPTTNSSAFVGDLRPMQKRGRILDLEGNVVTAPWMRMWTNSSWGCVNSPDYRQSYLTRLKQYADLGADTIHTDDPGNNWTACNWGGCFCEHCMAGFNEYLKSLDEKQREELGVRTLDEFNYAEHLRAQKAPVGDAFAKHDGGMLKKHFIEFQRQSVESFYKDMWSSLDKHAGRHVSISSNNWRGQWGFPYYLFDFGMAELPHRDANPVKVREALLKARSLGKAQVFTFVSTDVAENRRVIAMCYANGGHLIVPWDVYLKSTPDGSERYFGKPEEYADLYHFVRDHAKYFDGYEDAAVTGPGMVDKRYEVSPLKIEGGNDVFAFARVQPGKADAPIAVHLLNWSDTPQTFELTWSKASMAGERRVRAELLTPGEKPRSVAVKDAAEAQSVRIEKLPLWSLLVISPK